MVVVRNAEGRVCYVITTNSVVHSRLRFHSYGWGWIPDSAGWIPDSRDWIPDSKAQDSGFQRQKMLDSGFRIPLHGATSAFRDMVVDDEFGIGLVYIAS